MLLRDKITRCLRSRPRRAQTFRVLVDPIQSRYSKADEATHVICNNALAKVFGGRRPVDGVLTRDSKASLLIQLCDVLLGATMAAWGRDVSSDERIEFQRTIAGYLGWKDLRAGTFRAERKFNVWVFYDPTRGPRRAMARPIELRIPLVLKQT
jgi:hypothetical protein